MSRFQRIGKYLCKSIDIPSRNSCYVTKEGDFFIKEFKNPNNFYQEIDFLNRCYNINQVVNCYDYLIFNNRRFIVYPYLNGKDLYYSNYNNELTNVQKNKIFYQILKGMDDIHKQGFIHGDLKQENIFILNDMSVRIIDYEFCKSIYKINQNKLKRFGTLSYLSPEKANLSVLSQKSDIWALGILYYKLINYKEPYKYSYLSSNYFFPNKSRIISDSIVFNDKELALFDLMVQDNYQYRKGTPDLIKFMKDNILV